MSRHTPEHDRDEQDQRGGAGGVRAEHDVNVSVVARTFSLCAGGTAHHRQEGLCPYPRTGEAVVTFPLSAAAAFARASAASRDISSMDFVCSRAAPCVSRSLTRVQL